MANENQGPIAPAQGAPKLSEISVDLAENLIGTPANIDAMTMADSMRKVLQDSQQRLGLLLTSQNTLGGPGSVAWSGTDIIFSLTTNIVVELLQNALGNLVPLVMTAGNSNGETTFSDLPLANGYILYIELERELIQGPGPVILHNAVSGGSVVSGMTVKSATSMPALTSADGVPQPTMYIPIAMNLDGSIYWIPHGIFWPSSTTSPLGAVISSTSLPVGAFTGYTTFGGPSPYGYPTINIQAPGFALCDGSVIIDPRSPKFNPTRNTDGTPMPSYNPALDVFTPAMNGTPPTWSNTLTWNVGDYVSGAGGLIYSPFISTLAPNTTFAATQQVFGSPGNGSSTAWSWAAQVSITVSESTNWQQVTFQISSNPATISALQALIGANFYLDIIRDNAGSPNGGTVTGSPIAIPTTALVVVGSGSNFNLTFTASGSSFIPTQVGTTTWWVILTADAAAANAGFLTPSQGLPATATTTAFLANNAGGAGTPPTSSWYTPVPSFSDFYPAIALNSGATGIITMPYSYAATSGDVTIEGGTTQIAVQFMVTAAITITQLQLALVLRPGGSGPAVGNLIFEILNDSSGTPGVTVYGSGSFPASTVTASVANYSVDVDAVLAPGTYWFNATGDSTYLSGSGTNAVNIAFGTGSNTMKYYNGSAWGTFGSGSVLAGVITGVAPGTSDYVAIQAVPTGVALSNTAYWQPESVYNNVSSSNPYNKYRKTTQNRHINTLPRGSTQSFDNNTSSAYGGSNSATLTQAMLPNVNFPITDPGHSHSMTFYSYVFGSGQFGNPCNSGYGPSGNFGTSTNTTGITVSSGGSGAPLPVPAFLNTIFIVRIY